MKSKLIWWTSIGALAVCSGLGAQMLAIPGAWFVAAMIIAVVAGLIVPDHPRISKPVLMGAQAVIGTMLGANIRPDVFPLLFSHLPAMIGVIVFTIGISIVMGIVLPRISSLNRETAAMGSLPGGAGAMIALSIGTGADTKIVALMQYLRMILVVLTASLIARFLSIHAPATTQYLPGHHAIVNHGLFDYAIMPFIAVAGVLIGRLIHLPTAPLLGPMLLGLLISVFHLCKPVWPVYVPQLTYITLGFYVGLLFDRKSLLQAGRLAPLIITNIFVLIALCALGGLLFSRLIGETPLAGYLATSPGGGDTISIIAFGSGANVSLIFTVQIFRALVIMFTGPYITKVILYFNRNQSANDKSSNLDLI